MLDTKCVNKMHEHDFLYHYVSNFKSRVSSKNPPKTMFEIREHIITQHLTIILKNKLSNPHHVHKPRRT